MFPWFLFKLWLLKNSLDNEVQIETIQLYVKVDADFVCQIYGDSMKPEYFSGDNVFVKLSVDLPSGTVGVFDYEGEAYIKQLIIEKDKAYLRSFNKKYKDIPINSDSDFRIIGKVVDVYRKESEKWYGIFWFSLQKEKEKNLAGKNEC